MYLPKLHAFAVSPHHHMCPLYLHRQSWTEVMFSPLVHLSVFLSVCLFVCLQNKLLEDLYELCHWPRKNWLFFSRQLIKGGCGRVGWDWHIYICKLNCWLQRKRRSWVRQAFHIPDLKKDSSWQSMIGSLSIRIWSMKSINLFIDRWEIYRFATT